MSERADIPSILIIGTAAALVAACGREPTVAGPPETRAERLAVLDRIAAECRVPRAMMELIGEDALLLRPAPDEDYERVDCVLRRLDGLNLPSGRLGFVGNEAPAAEANNAQAR